MVYICDMPRCIIYYAGKAFTDSVSIPRTVLTSLDVLYDCSVTTLTYWAGQFKITLRHGILTVTETPNKTAVCCVDATK